MHRDEQPCVGVLREPREDTRLAPPRDLRAGAFGKVKHPTRCAAEVGLSAEGPQPAASVGKERAVPPSRGHPIHPSLPAEAAGRRRSVSEGRSPNTLRYSPAKRPSSVNPFMIASEVTVHSCHD